MVGRRTPTSWRRWVVWVSNRSNEWVATHADSDHVGGLDDVLDALPVSVVTVGPRAEDAVDLLDTAARLDVPVEEVSAGFTWDHGQFSITVLSPPGTGLGRERNDNSLVMRIDGPPGSPSVLLPGDVEVLAQDQLLRSGDPAVLQSLDVDVLLVPHHGGNTSLPAFLTATTPEVAVISVGAGNAFGHPHPDVLANLGGVDIRRTDLDGDVVVSLDARRPPWSGE